MVIAVAIDPKPVPGNHYHFSTLACFEPGYQDPNPSRQSVWDCGPEVYYHAARQRSLTRAPTCVPMPDGSLHSGFTFQYQGGPVEEGRLTLPSGTGIPVGGKSGPTSVIVIFHYPEKGGLLDGLTGRTEVGYTLIRPPSAMQPVKSIFLKVLGFVGPRAVGSVTGSVTWTSVPIQALRLYTHWHELTLRLQAWIETTSGHKSKILDQDARSYLGVTNVTDLSSAILGPGDTLTFQCTYNNTLSTLLRVQ